MMEGHKIIPKIRSRARSAGSASDCGTRLGRLGRAAIKLAVRKAGIHDHGEFQALQLTTEVPAAVRSACGLREKHAGLGTRILNDFSSPCGG